MAYRVPFAAALAAVVIPDAALACSTADAGARCVEARPEPVLVAALSGPAAAGPLSPGDVMEPGTYSVLLNAAYYGLPPAADGWVYVRAERQLVRMDWRSRTVIDDVTARAAANF